MLFPPVCKQTKKEEEKSMYMYVQGKGSKVPINSINPRHRPTPPEEKENEEMVIVS